jgi:hypothetical protein
MNKNPADVVGCRYDFWRLIRKHAPEVIRDLFDRDRDRMWNTKEWEARLERVMADPDNPRGTGPHPAALAWSDHWKLPDWCLARAEYALSAVPSRQLKTQRYQDLDRWRKAVSHSSYYFKPPALKLTLNLWAADEVFTMPTRDELKRRALEAVARCMGGEVARYDEKYIQPLREGKRSWLFPSLDKAANRKFELHAKWLIYYKLKDKPQKVIALDEGVTEQAVSRAIAILAEQLGFDAEQKNILEG